MFEILFKLFFVFFKIGLFTFGGGYAMIPLITDDILRYGWVANSNVLTDFIGISESTPGPFAINIATFIGFEQAGILGAIAATLGVALPSLIVILIIAKAFKKFQTNKYVIGFLEGVRPTIVGIILAVGITFILTYVFDINILKLSSLSFNWQILWKNLAIFAVILSLSKTWKRVNPIILVVLSGILGYVLFGVIG